MRCPFCGHCGTFVKDSRSSEDDGCIKRRRMCLKCGRRFTTHERLVVRTLQVLKRHGSIEMFDREKLYRSLCVATRKCDISDDQIERTVADIMDQLEKKLPPITTDAIGDLAMYMLKKLNKVAYVRYASVYKSFAELRDFSNFLQQADVVD